MQKLLGSMIVSAALLQGTSLQETISSELHKQMPMACEGVSVEVRDHQVVLMGQALCVADREAMERIASMMTERRVLNEIVIDDPYLRDGF